MGLVLFILSEQSWGINMRIEKTIEISNRIHLLEVVVDRIKTAIDINTKIFVDKLEKLEKRIDKLESTFIHKAKR